MQSIQSYYIRTYEEQLLKYINLLNLDAKK